MLKRIYADNYKSLVNFEFQPGPINLLLGPNGAGKTAVFEVVQRLRDFVGGQGKITQLFPSDNLTRWQASLFRTLELDVAYEQDVYKYELSIEHDKTSARARIAFERLSFNNQPLLKFEMGEVQLFRDNHSAGPVYPFDWALSAVASITPRQDNTRLTWFKKYIENLLIIRPVPGLIEGESAQEERWPSLHLENFVSWYRFLSQDQGLALRLTNELRDVLPGFEYFKFDQNQLKAVFSAENGKGLIEYRFSELSDGQRMLIALYTLLHAAQSNDLQPGTLLIDEPENFIALPEIQPWLTALYDLCNQDKVQAILISHHPELINYLLASPGGYWFERESNRPTRIKPISADPGENRLPISELTTRGWTYAQSTP
jgi:predicted ATPase